MVARFKATVGGSWTLAGSCPRSCTRRGRRPDLRRAGAGRLRGPGGRHTPQRRARLRHRGAARHRLLRSRSGDRRERQVCEPGRREAVLHENENDETARVLPLLGLGGTSLAARAFPTPNTFPARVPVAKLLGRRRFAILLPPARLDGCPTFYYTTCEESGQIRMRLTFTPARRRPPGPTGAAAPGMGDADSS